MNNATHTSLTLAEAHEFIEAIKHQTESKIYGQEDLITEALCCFLSGGHILMTGAPGLAKTTLVRVIAEQLGLWFKRVQFTPDLLPSDIIGTEVLSVDPETSKRYFEFSKGPIFTNLLLADEINRASPRTQSALLEAMQEHAVTVAGTRYPLDAPFMVFATQNPFESEGTFPLPEAQLDRFLLHSLVHYPDVVAEEKILRAHCESRLVGELHGALFDGHDEKVKRLTLEEILNLQKACRQVHVADPLIELIRDLIRSSRPHDEHCPDSLKGALVYGAGPRAGISLVSVARALALMEGQAELRWRHVKRLAKPVLRHRIRLSIQARRDQLDEDQVIDQLIQATEQRYTQLIEQEKRV